MDIDTSRNPKQNVDSNIPSNRHGKVKSPKAFGCREIEINNIYFAQKTAPPMINTRSSSLRIHCTTLFAACVTVCLDAPGAATQYSSNTGVTQASAVASRDTA